MPWSRSAAARSPTSPASSRPPGCAGWRWCTCRRPCWRWSTPPSGARPASTPPRARTSWARSTSPPGVVCDLDVLATLPRADLVAGLAEVDQGGVHRRPGASSTSSRPTRPVRRAGTARTPASCVERADRGQGRRRRAGPHRVVAARDPQLRAHLRPRGRAGRGLPAPPRRGGRHRHDVCRGARPARRAAWRPTSSPGTARCCRRWVCPRATRGVVGRPAGRDAPRQEVAR